MEGPSVDVPEEFKKDAKVGLADRILQAKEEERKRLKAIEDKKSKKASKGKGKETARSVSLFQFRSMLMKTGKKRAVIPTLIQHPTRTRPAPDQGQGRPYAQRKPVDIQLHAQDLHLHGDVHEVRPTPDHHRPDVGGVHQIRQHRQENDLGVRLVGLRVRFSCRAAQKNQCEMNASHTMWLFNYKHLI